MLAETVARPRPDLNGGVHHRAKAKRVSNCSCQVLQPMRHLRLQASLIRLSGRSGILGRRSNSLGNPGLVMKSPWNWKQQGQCGKWVSDLVPPSPHA